MNYSCNSCSGIIRVMTNGRMKQRVAVALATVWLASIVGASVPLGVTPAYPILRSPGPLPDQYTPALLRNPRNYRQDDYGRDWMNDEPSRMKVANRRGGSDRMQSVTTDPDESIPFGSTPNELQGRRMVKDVDDSRTSHRFQSSDMRTDTESDREAMKLSSIKVAFDDPIDSELSVNNSQEDWISHDIEEDGGAIESDEFLADDTFEDEGPGSVEVYKLDLRKDRVILNPQTPGKNYLKHKSKMPKKVNVVDQISRKVKDPEESNYRAKSSTRFDRYSDRYSSPPKSIKERIFGVGGVPELQVGCEGVENSGRQKRSDNSHGSTTTPNGSILHIDLDYDSDEYLDVVAGGDELVKILKNSMTPTARPTSGRGDIDPRVETPADLEAKKKLQRKDELPIRGDLGAAANENFGVSINGQESVNRNENPLRTLWSPVENYRENSVTRFNNRRKLLSLDEHENLEQRLDRGNEKHDSILNKHGKRRRHRYSSSHPGRRNGTERHRRREGERKREGKEIRRKNKAIDKIRKDNEKKRKEKNHKRTNEVLQDTDVSSQPLTLLRPGPSVPPTHQHEKNKDDQQQIEKSKRSAVERRIMDENEKKLDDYKRRNTPIPRRKILKNNRGKTQSQQDNDIAPENLRRPVTPLVNDNRRVVDEYAVRRAARLQEQRQREAEKTNKVVHRTESERRRPAATRRPQNQTQDSNSIYKLRSRQEIERIYALPVKARIVIQQEKSNNVTPDIGSRFNEDDDKIGFTGLNPTSNGLRAPQFPAPPTRRPPVEGPSPCVWAIINCCSNKNRLASCFEAKGCPGGTWDPDPCTPEKTAIAIQMVSKYYGD